MKEFEITVSVNGTEDVLKISSSSIIGALERAHKDMQIQHGVPGDKYKVVSAVHVYSASGRVGYDDMIKSSYPVPGGPNPDMWEITGKIKPLDLTTGKN